VGERRHPTGLAAAVLIATLLLPSPVALAAASFDGVPGAPTLVSPIDGETITTRPILRWLAGVNGSTYGVKVWKAGHPEQEACGGGGGAGLQRECDDVPPGTYEWSVQSFGVNGREGGISAIGSFVRASPSIAAPALLTPANGATLDYPDDVGVLRWAPAAGAELYQFQVSTSPTFAEGAPDLLYSFATTSADVPREHIGVPQYWRVRGVNFARTWSGPWSATRSFTVTWADVPAPVSPADGASASNVVLAWSMI
jgi:hypothetical protein